MRVTSSYKVEILKLKRPLERTLKISRSAAAWLLPVIDGEWEGLSEYEGEKRRFNEAEKLIHTTKKNKAGYPFDEAFPKMPSYLRRAVLQHVIGLVSSARTREASGKAGVPGERDSEKKRATKTRDHYMVRRAGEVTGAGETA